MITRKSSSREYLLLGPVRFINSDCDPNCEYEFTSDDDIVRIRTLKKIKPGDEVTVKYGDEFFAANTCQCRTCEIKDCVIDEALAVELCATFTDFDVEVTTEEVIALQCNTIKMRFCELLCDCVIIISTIFMTEYLLM